MIDLTQVLGLFSYFIGLQFGGGRTIGQKTVGLRLIALDALELEDAVPFSRLVLRELLYFPLACLGFGIGVLMIVTRKDRMGLHDLLSRTRVVMVSQETGAEPVRTSVVLGIFASVAVVAVLGFVGVVYWTPYPLRQTVQSLELLGYKVGRISGTLGEGFRIESLAFENDEIALEFKGVRFRYQAIETGAALETLTVSEAAVSIRRWPLEMRWPSVNLHLEIDSADVRNIRLEIPNRPPLFFRRIFLSEVGIEQSINAMTVARVWADSEALSADLQEVVIQGSSIGVAKTSYLQLKPALHVEVIGHPIDLTFEGFYRDGVFEKFRIEGFKGRVKLNLDRRSAELAMSGFTPAHYFRTGLPLWNFTLMAKGDLLAGQIADVQGSVDLRNMRFEADASGFHHRRGGRLFEMRPRPEGEWLEALGGAAVAAYLSSSDFSNVQAVLAEIYFSQPVADLSTSELEMVEHDEKYFAWPPEDPAANSPRAPARAPGAATSAEKR